VRKAREDSRRWAAQPPADAAAAEAAWQGAVEDLEAFRRQSVVYGMYGRKMKTVLVSLGGGWLVGCEGGVGGECCGVYAAEMAGGRTLQKTAPFDHHQPASTDATRHTPSHAPSFQEIDHEAAARKAGGGRGEQS